MKTTTVRFDLGAWEGIVRESERLEIAHAAFIRDAVVERLARLDNEDRLSQAEQRIDDLTRQQAATARTVTTIAARIGMTSARPPRPS